MTKITHQEWIMALENAYTQATGKYGYEDEPAFEAWLQATSVDSLLELLDKIEINR